MRETFYRKLISWVDDNRDFQECFDLGADKTNGYNRISVNKKNLFAHRISCERVHGPPTKEKPFALHACNNRFCVNPNHLRWGSHSENMKDIFNDRNTAAALNRVKTSRINLRSVTTETRRANGILNGRASRKLTPSEVIEIRRLDAKGYTRAHISKFYPVNSRSISNLLLGKSYAGVGDICSHCGSEALVRRGWRSLKLVYRCNNCGKYITSPGRFRETDRDSRVK